jgi:hypothetical protein
MIAWSLRSPGYGYLFYGSAIKSSEQLLKEARRDFPEVDDFCAPVLLETDEGNRVREWQALQEECDRENAEFFLEENKRRIKISELVSQFKAQHGISATDKCSSRNCGKPAVWRFEGQLYCLGHTRSTLKAKCIDPQVARQETKETRTAEVKAAEIVRPKREWTDAELETLQGAWKSAEIARPEAVRRASEVAKVLEESQAPEIAELQAAWDVARRAPHKAAQIARLRIERENHAAELARFHAGSQSAHKDAEIESAAFSSRMKSLHGISANDKCSVNSCGIPAELRFDGRPYCLGHFWDTKAAAEMDNSEEGRCSD